MRYRPGIGLDWKKNENLQNYLNIKKFKHFFLSVLSINEEVRLFFWFAWYYVQIIVSFIHSFFTDLTGTHAKSAKNFGVDFPLHFRTCFTDPSDTETEWWEILSASGWWSFSFVNSFCFLVADTQLYKRLCPLVRPSVRWSVRPSVGPFVILSNFHTISVSGCSTWKVEKSRPQLFCNFGFG